MDDQLLDQIREENIKQHLRLIDARIHGVGTGQHEKEKHRAINQAKTIVREWNRSNDSRRAN